MADMTIRTYQRGNRSDALLPKVQPRESKPAENIAYDISREVRCIAGQALADEGRLRKPTVKRVS